MRVLIGTLLYLVFAVLVASGTALAVAAISVVLGRRWLPAGIDSAGVRAGRWSQLRRYGLCWLALTCVWLLGVGLVTQI
ncbi:MAG TPA: hypothetical protein VFT45_05705 [Longimicrobium sp.]|nr:hypothetical protein [Longimicrobium sp.]